MTLTDLALPGDDALGEVHQQPQRSAAARAYIAFFALFPLWWLLGAASLIWCVPAIPVAVHLYRRRERLRYPRGFVLLGLFMVWMLASATRVDTADRSLAFGLRFLVYASAGALLLFVVNPPAGLSQARILQGVVLLWFVAVAGGWLGLLLPNLEFNGPLAAFVPVGLRSQVFVQELFRVGTADTNSFLGFPIARPRAPFPYTNRWGASVGLLVPLAVAALHTRTGLPPILIRLSLVLAVPPIVVSLNRGLWLSIAFGVFYAGIRLAAAGRTNALIGGLALLLAATLVALLTPLGALAIDRINTPHSDVGRLTLYQESIERSLDAPLLGHGTPRPSENANSPSVGTHGMAWYTMFSHGFVGMALYLGFYVLALWHTRSPTTQLGFAAHVTVFIALVQTSFYGHFNAPMCIAMIAIGIAYAETTRTRRQPLRPAGDRAPLPGPLSTTMRHVRGQIARRAESPAAHLNASTADWTAALRPGVDVREPNLDWSEDRVDKLSSFLWSGQSGARFVSNGSSGDQLQATYLAQPDAADPELLIPVHRRVGARAAYRPSNGSPIRQRLKIVGTSAAIRIGLAPIFSPTLDVVGNRPLNELGPPDALASHIADLLNEPELIPAMSIGRNRRIRKPVVGLYRPDGTPVAFAKIAVDELTRSLVTNEATWLARLDKNKSPHFEAPRLMAFTTWEGREVTVMSPLPVSIIPRRRPTALPPIGVLRGIAHLVQTRTGTVADSAFISRHREATKHDPFLADLVEGVAHRVGDIELNFGSWHGDLAPWNINTTRHSTGIFDWEFAGTDVPFGFDAYNAGVQIWAIREQLAPRSALGQARSNARTALEYLGVDSGECEFATWICYLVELLTRCELLLDVDRVDQLHRLHTETLSTLQLVVARG